MKYWLPVLFVFLVRPCLANGPDLSEANREIAKSSCSYQKDAEQIRALKPVVPGHLFHIGRTDHLFENIAVGNVPQDDWDNHIMNGKGRWGLGTSRRGLYGTIGLDTNTVGAGAYNWIMRISIRPECRRPERVATLENLHLDKRFLDWYPKAKRPFTLDEFKSKCAITYFTPRSYHNNNCDQIAINFMKDLKIAIVQDHIMKKSYYIRDRNCISGIDGTPDEWIRMLTDMPNLWRKHCESSDHGVNLPGILFKSLIGMKDELSLQQADKLRANVQGVSDELFITIKNTILSAVDAKLRCGPKMKSELQKIVSPPEDDSFAFYTFMNPAHFQALCR